MILKDCVPIIYPPGYYGHFMYYILDNFTTHGQQNANFTLDEYGGSHNEQQFTTKWSEFKQGNITPYFPTHLYDYNQTSQVTLFNQITSDVNKCIVIQYTKGTMLTATNNVFDKAAGRDLDAAVKFMTSAAPYGPLNSIAEYREFFSYKIFYDKWLRWFPTNENNIQISLNDILYKFDSLLPRIAKFLNTEITDLNGAMALHEKMKGMQQQLNKDEQIRDFLEGFINRTDRNLPADCSIIDESYIQKFLRDTLKLELRCNDIGDKFPATSEELWKYVYEKDLM